MYHLYETDYIHQVQGQVNKIIEKNDTGHHKNGANSAFRALAKS